jgi:hypothetical protein
MALPICKRQVAGSSPTVGSTLLNESSSLFGETAIRAFLSLRALAGTCLNLGWQTAVPLLDLRLAASDVVSAIGTCADSEVDGGHGSDVADRDLSM